MKKRSCILLIVCLLLSLSACRRKTPTVSNTSETNQGNTQTSTVTNAIEENTELVAVSVPAVTENTTAEDGTVIFQYTYQNMTLVLHKPQVADKVILDFLNRVDNTRTNATTTADMAKSAYDGSKSWIPYLYHITYSPTRIDHNVLSLFGNNVVFSGAGHPERTCVSANYDLLTGDVLTLASIMNKDATMQQFLSLVLDGLAEMAEGDYLYENYKDIVYNRFFDSDPAHDEYWYFTQTGLSFYFAPYEIAPYSSGVVTVEIPYEKLKDLVHADYLPQKRNTASGTPTVFSFEKVDLESLEHVAELVANKDGNMYMVQCSGHIQDVRIMVTDPAASYTAFAAYNLTPGNGIMVQADDALLKLMKLSYKSNNEAVVTPLIK